MNMVNDSGEMPQKSALRRRAPRAVQFSIADILIATTMVGVLLGAAVVSPPLAVGLFLLVFAALVRTLIVRALYRMQPGGGELTSFWLELLASIAIIFWSGLLGGAIFLGGLLLGFAQASNGGQPIPDAAMWPIVLSLTIAAIVVGAILWMTRSVTRSSF